MGYWKQRSMSMSYSDQDVEYGSSSHRGPSSAGGHSSELSLNTENELLN